MGVTCAVHKRRVQSDQSARVRLDLLLARLPSARIVRGAADREVMSVEIDSRRVRPGTLFCCVPGMITDGHEYVDAAARAGLE